jgi:hypothetical protein
VGGTSWRVGPGNRAVKRKPMVWDCLWYLFGDEDAPFWD